MKARVKGTEKIVEVDYIEGNYLHTSAGLYLIDELEGIESNPDYWTRLEHQAAIAAMQGIISKQTVGHKLNTITDLCCDIAHALVEKYKEKEERK